LANFVGCVVGFLSVCTIRLRCLLLAAVLSFEIERYKIYILEDCCRWPTKEIKLFTP
jgi:hypothetical protein